MECSVEEGGGKGDLSAKNTPFKYLKINRAGL